MALVRDERHPPISWSDPPPLLWRPVVEMGETSLPARPTRKGPRAGPMQSPSSHPGMPVLSDAASLPRSGSVAGGSHRVAGGSDRVEGGSDRVEGGSGRVEGGSDRVCETRGRPAPPATLSLP